MGNTKIFWMGMLRALLAVGAITLAWNGMEGWGWLLFVLAISFNIDD